MGIFNKYNEIEKQLLELYTQMFIEMNLPDAKATAKDMLDRAIEKSKKEGTYYLPNNFGDIILGIEAAEQPITEKMAEIFRKTLPQKKEEGVRDEDIRWWWNLNDVERKMMLSMDDFHRLSLFINEINNGKTPEEAGRIMWKAHPMYTYGDPNTRPKQSPFDLKREDFPLPVELKDRVNRYIEKRLKDDPENIKKDLEGFSTFNAFVRKEIKAGNL